MNHLMNNQSSYKYRLERGCEQKSMVPSCTITVMIYDMNYWLSYWTMIKAMRKHDEIQLNNLNIQLNLNIFHTPNNYDETIHHYNEATVDCSVL